jgi:hypothetical protein
MRYLSLSAIALASCVVSTARGYVEAPYTLGRTCSESTNVVLMEVARINAERGLIIFKKVQDLKGKHPDAEIKHNIGKNGFHPREWQNVMAWAAVGKKAVFFHNGGASETCLGTYWYQCFKGGDWWTMSHAEPFMARTFHGDPEKLAQAVVQVVAGKEVVVTCLADGAKEQFHQRKGKLQRVKASLKRMEYNARRDFVGLGGEGDEVEEFKTTVLLAESTPGWKFVPAEQARAVGDRWRLPDFDDRQWRSGKAPVGYGEAEIAKRAGTVIQEQGVPFLFRRVIDVPAALLTQKGVTFRLCVASDDSAVVYLNGVLVDQDPEADHEFTYWNRDVEVNVKHFKPGRNVIAVLVKNRKGSSDLYLDMEVSAQVPLPRKVPVKKPPVTNPATPGVRPE